MSFSMPFRIGQGLLQRRWISGGLAVLLLAISLLIAWQREQADIAEQSRQISAQAAILAGSVAGALAFDDAETMREHLEALKVDRDIQAAGIYRPDGTRVAGLTRQGGELPERARAQPPTIAGRQLMVVEPVHQGNLFLGYVYLRTSMESIGSRISRYLAIGVVILLAALLIGILGASNAAAAEANRELREQVLAREDAERQLRQAQKMEALGQLTGGVAHDFNNLLMAASSGMELLDRAKTEDRRDRLKAGIRDAIDRGARLTQQLLSFSRRTPVQTDVVIVGRHVDKLTELLNHSLREDIVVAFDIPGGIWPVEVDASQLDVAILNLAVNARDAMPKGGRICIAARNQPGALPTGDAVEVSVRDDGVGMPPEAIEKAFEPFFTTKEMGRGTGLGLSQVYGFARASGGDVAISSELEAGTTVKILLPRSRPAPAVSEEVTRAVGADGLHGLRILLVEDDPALNELVGQMLEELGAEVVRTSSAAEALAVGEVTSVDAVLSDMVMPGDMDGLDLARRLRERRRDIPIVLMTGYSEAATAAAEEGFPILRKPFTIERLTGKLADAVGSGPSPAGS